MILRVILIFILAFISNISFAENNDWLLGKWKMTYDPDGDTKDVLLFSPQSQFVTTEVSTGKQYKGIYFLKQNAVDVSLMNGDQIFMKLKLTFTEKKDKLYYNPDNTNDPAYYTKLQ